jgi:hypothetical protein
VTGTYEYNRIHLLSLKLMVGIGRRLAGIGIASVGADQPQQLASDRRLINLSKIVIHSAGQALIGAGIPGSSDDRTARS